MSPMTATTTRPCRRRSSAARGRWPGGGGWLFFNEPHERDRELLPHDPFKALVVPRPIGWLSTLGPEGEPNLAPYSFFNAVCDRPPMLMFSSDGMKDSSTFGEASGESAGSVGTGALPQAVTASSLPWRRAPSTL